MSEEVDFAALARKVYPGLSVVADSELVEWRRYSASVGQPLTEEGLVLWMTRTAAGQCVVCGKPAKGRFCDTHKARLTRERRW